MRATGTRAAMAAGAAVLTIPLAACQPGSYDEGESPDVASLATATPGETESVPANQIPDDPDDLQFDPIIHVSDQESDGTHVVVDGVDFATPKGLGTEGWLVVRADADGGPGHVLGYRQLPAAGLDGPTEIELDEPLQPEGGVRDIALWVGVHLDGDPQGEFQWPGSDRPLVRGGDRPFVEGFTVTVVGDTEVATTPTPTG